MSDETNAGLGGKNMNERIKLKLGKVCNGSFLPALRTLCHMRGLLAKDAYGLRRTWDLVQPEVETYWTTVGRLMRDHGAKLNTAELREQIEKIRNSKFLNHEVGVRELTEEEKKCLENLEKQLAEIVAAGKEQLSLERSTPGFGEYEKQLQALNDTEVEIYLDHGVRLPERVELTAAEMGEIFELIEEPQ